MLLALAAVGPLIQGMKTTLKAGARLRARPDWPSLWVEIMHACWEEKPTARPTFAMVLTHFERLL